MTISHKLSFLLAEKETFLLVSVPFFCLHLAFCLLHFFCRTSSQSTPVQQCLPCTVQLKTEDSSPDTVSQMSQSSERLLPACCPQFCPQDRYAVGAFGHKSSLRVRTQLLPAGLQGLFSQFLPRQPVSPAWAAAGLRAARGREGLSIHYRVDPHRGPAIPFLSTGRSI